MEEKKERRGEHEIVGIKEGKKIISVFAHEIGHCFGLNENNTNSKSIMCQAGYGRRVTSVQSCDFAGVHRLYK